MTTLEPYTLTCPLCGNMFETTMVASTNTLGPLHSDFYREASGAQPICHFVHSCTSCGYSGFEGDFHHQEFSTDFRQLVEQYITPEVREKAPGGAVRYYLAALCAEWRGASPVELARIYHMGSWCCRSLKEREKELFYLGRACVYFELALSEGVVDKDMRAMFTYMVGDIYRRTEQPEKANEWYGKVEAEAQASGGEAKIVEYAKKQLAGPKNFFS